MGDDVSQPGVRESRAVARQRQVARLGRLVLKELREILRDRRTIITLVVMPLLIYPLLAIVFQRFLLTSLSVHRGGELCDRRRFANGAADARTAVADGRSSFAGARKSGGGDTGVGREGPGSTNRLAKLGGDENAKPHRPAVTLSRFPRCESRAIRGGFVVALGRGASTRAAG